MFQEYRGVYLVEGQLPEGCELIANPLGGSSDVDRESRVFGRKSGNRVTYGAFVISLIRRGRELAILTKHGGGYEIASLYSGPDKRAVEAELLAMDERTLYATLFSVSRAIRNAAESASNHTAAVWRKAHSEKRIRQKTYRARGIRKIWIEPEREEGESDESYAMRKRFAAPA